jgi:Fe-S cluster biogenesis protein NfuA
MRKTLLAIALFSSLFIIGCKPKDTDLKATIEAALKADSTLSKVIVDVKEGVATMSGELNDSTVISAAKKIISAVKGIKSTVNNCTIAMPQAPVPASVTTTLDATVIQTLKDGLKDIKGVVADFSTEKPALSGEVSSKDRMKIMQIFAAAKIVPDVTMLTTKK